jgi:hypothetical protein
MSLYPRLALSSAALVTTRLLASAYAQPATDAASVPTTHGIEAYLSENAMQALYTRRMDVGELGVADLHAGVFFNEDRDLVGIGDLLTDVADANRFFNVGLLGADKRLDDCLHPRDILPMLLNQFAGASAPRVVNVSGGVGQTMSLRQLSEWCATRFGAYAVDQDPIPRAFDVPWMVLDASLARGAWTWAPETALETILDEIAVHAEAHRGWLEISNPR